MFSPMKRFGNQKSLRVDVVEAEELLGEIANGILDVEPVLALIEMNIPEAMRFDHVELFVLPLAQVRVDHDGAVVARMNQRGIVAIGLHGTDDAIELPGSSGASRKEEMPGDIDFERGVNRLVDDLLIAGEVQQLMVVVDDRGRLRLEDSDGGS